MRVIFSDQGSRPAMVLNALSVTVVIPSPCRTAWRAVRDCAAMLAPRVRPSMLD